MAKRKAIGKRVRFEIFKRDGFKCAYCGRSPPDVLLQVDHIVAVAAGGDNEPTNLITACSDCNNGKSDKPLTAVAPPLEEQARIAKERAEQVKAYADAVIEARQNQDETVQLISDAWYAPFNPDPSKHTYSFPKERVPSIRKFLTILTVPEILDAVDIAHGAISRKPDLRVYVDREYSLSDGKLFRYFCGVCWRMADTKKGAA